MSRLRRVCILLGLLFAPFVAAQGKDDPPPKRKPKFTVGKDTTYVDGPLDKNGHIDYVAALNERLREGVTPDNNAGVLLWQAFGPSPNGIKVAPEFFEALKMPVPPEKGDYLVSVATFTKAAAIYTEEFDKTLRTLGSTPWTAREYPRFAEWLQRNEKPLATIAAATKRPQYYYPLLTPKLNGKRTTLIAALIPGVYESREVAHALTARAMLQLGEGKTDQAWQDLQTCHRLGRLVARGGTVIELVVGIAVDQIASDADLVFLDAAKLDAKKLKACLSDLQALPKMSAPADKIALTERFLFLDTVMQLDYHGVGYIDGLLGGNNAPSGLGGLAMRLLFADIHWDSALKNGNAIYTRMAAAMRLGDRALREKQLDEIENDIKSIKANLLTTEQFTKTLFTTKNPADAKGKYLGDVMITLLTPAVRKVQGAADRNAQVQRNLHLAFALAAFKSEQGGRYPPKFDALSPKYLATIPDDLFSGKALIYRPAGDTYLLYSVGINGKDEGGRSPDEELPGDDLAVRMPRRRIADKK